MANHFSALKRARQTTKRTARNRANSSQLRTALRSLRESLEKGDKTNAVATYRQTVSALDKAIQRTQKSHNNKKDLEKLHTMAASVEAGASTATDAADAKRLHELAQILDHPVA